MVKEYSTRTLAEKRKQKEGGRGWRDGNEQISCRRKHKKKNELSFFWLPADTIGYNW